MATPARAHLESLLRARKLDATLDAAHPLQPDAPEPAPSGLAWLDGRLGGGWPRGQVSEVVGPRSSGRSWLAAQAVAQATRQGELAALVDATDSFDPASLAHVAVHWPHLLWVRGRVPVGGAATRAAQALQEQELDRALKAMALVLQAGGFGVAVLDVGDVPAALLRQLPFTTWLRLARLVEGRDTACVLLAPEPLARSARGVSVRLSGGTAAGRWSGDHASSRWLAGLATHARLVRARWRAEDEQEVVVPTAVASPAGSVVTRTADGRAGTLDGLRRHRDGRDDGAGVPGAGDCHGLCGVS
jgi:hypothetical protein